MMKNELKRNFKMLKYVFIKKVKNILLKETDLFII